jgi:hypothetical protein
MPTSKPGLYANIAAKRSRITQGSNERMARPGEASYLSASAFKAAAKTTKAAKAKKAKAGKKK